METQAGPSAQLQPWVPRYNQVGMLALGTSSPSARPKKIAKFKAAMALAYADSAAARCFLEERGQTRPFIILAHSQGSILMVKVIGVPRRHPPRAELRRRLPRRRVRPEGRGLAVGRQRTSATGRWTWPVLAQREHRGRSGAERAPLVLELLRRILRGAGGRRGAQGARSGEPHLG